MQNDAGSIAAAYGNLTSSATVPSLQEQQNDIVLANSLYSSMFTPTYTDSLYDSRSNIVMQQQQDMVNRHNLCLTRLRLAAREAEDLRHENATLRSVNRELNNHLSRFIQSSVLHKHYASSDYCNTTTPFEIVNLLRGLRFGEVEEVEEEMCEEESPTPTSVMSPTSVNTERVTLPKSISVRSNGYLKMSQGGSKTRPTQATPSPLTGKVN